MYEARRKVFWFAIITRTIVLILQLVFNILCPDHHADAFKEPFDPREKISISICDNVISFIFNGLVKWDGQYFIHIAKYGYTYENMLAFYPLYPIAIRYTAIIISTIFFTLNSHSTVIIAAVIINFICFVLSAVVFYDLSKVILLRDNVAYKAAILYCINPATIFFSAAYTESMFAYLTYRGMLASVQNNPYTFLPLGLSTLVRSNGIINIAFPIYFQVKSICNKILIQIGRRENYGFIALFYRFILKELYLNLSKAKTIFIASLPFFLLQVYNYSIYCIPKLDTSLPIHIVDYGKRNNLVLQYNGTATWCHAKVPIAYSYVQEKYWNVGFFSYYEFKQIPNFILAFPVLCITILCIKEFFVEHNKHLYSLGFFIDIRNKKISKGKKYPPQMFVFVIHGLFLTVFCICFVHIQVSTRLLCSASPLVYWYCALSLSYIPDSKNARDILYEDKENILSKWRVFFLFQQKYTLQDKIILSYFLGYSVIGCFMFPNFLPWT